MPIEAKLLDGAPYFKEECPKCGAAFSEFMRGHVRRSKRFLGFLWRRPYCAVICHECKEIIGHESPEMYGRRAPDGGAERSER